MGLPVGSGGLRGWDDNLVPIGNAHEDDLVLLRAPSGGIRYRVITEALVGDALTGRGPHGADAVVRPAVVGDEQSFVGAVGVDEPELVAGSFSPPLYANVEPSGDHVRCAASTEPSWRSSPVDTE